MLKRPLSQTELEILKANLASFPNITRFFSASGDDDWFTQQIDRSRKSQQYHCVLGYLSNSLSQIYAVKMDEILSTILTHMPRYHPHIRKKLIDVGKDKRAFHFWEVHAFGEAWFEVELAALIASHGYVVEVEPGNKSSPGPDLKATIGGHDVFIEAKKPYIDANTNALTQKARELEDTIRTAIDPAPVQVLLWLHDPYPTRDRIDRLVADIEHRVKQTREANLWPEPFECLGGDGNSIAYVQINPWPNGEADVQGL